MYEYSKNAEGKQLVVNHGIFIANSFVFPAENRYTDREPVGITVFL